VAEIRGLSRLKPSTVMLRLLAGITFSDNATVLDAPCGFGRNTIALAARGLAVLSADIDRGRLDSLKRAVAELESSKQSHSRIWPVCVDLGNNGWPFLESSFSAVVCVHYPVQEIIENLKASLREGGYIYIETFGGQGDNARPGAPAQGRVLFAARASSEFCLGGRGNRRYRSSIIPQGVDS
jgi:SAM-dependent methyltransferase